MNDQTKTIRLRNLGLTNRIRTKQSSQRPRQKVFFVAKDFQEYHKFLPLFLEAMAGALPRITPKITG